MNVCDQNNVKLFLSDLNESSHCTLNIQSGKPGKNTNCSANLKLRLDNQ